MCNQYQGSVLRISNWKIFRFLFSRCGFFRKDPGIEPCPSIWDHSQQVWELDCISHPTSCPRELYVLSPLPCGHTPRSLKRPSIAWLCCQNLVSEGKYMRFLQWGVQKLGELQLEESGLWVVVREALW